jgi:RNA polymerase sigma-70 factor (ECF subfamily)
MESRDGFRQSRPGGRPSFQAIFQNEAQYVGSVLSRMGVRSCDLEDLTHDVFLVVHARLDEYDATRPLRPWLFGIALRVALRFRSLARHRYESPRGDIEVPGEAPSPHDLLAARRERELVAQALAHLDVNRRAVFVMHELRGIPIPEVATACAIPLNTAYSRLRSARELFADRVQRIRGSRERAAAATRAARSSACASASRRLAAGC